MARTLLSLFLCAALVCPPLAGARDFRAPTVADAEKYFAQVEKIMSGAGRKVMEFAPTMSRAEMLQKMKAGGKGTATAVVRSVGHNAHTLMLLWLLGAAEGIRQQEHLRSITPNESIRNPKNALERIHNWWKVSLEVGSHMVNSLELMASIAGGGAALTAATPALHTLNQLVAGSATRPFFAKLMTQGTGAFITFVGFEAGHQLISEAMFLLEEDEIKIAKELKFTEMMRGAGTPEQRMIFNKVLANAYDILTFAKPEVLSIWLHNTWRQRIGTGEFVTMLSAMVAAGVAAGTLVPGAGWVVGLLVGGGFGLVGGGAALFLPARYKRPITDFIRRGRMNTANSQLFVNETELKRVYRALENPHQPLADYLVREGTLLLKQRARHREVIVTYLFTQIYDAYLRIQDAEFILNTIRISEGVVSDSETRLPLDIEALKVEYHAEMAEARARALFYFEELLELQRREARFLGRSVYSPDSFSHPLYLTLDQHMKGQESIHQSFRHIYAGLLPEKLKEFGLDTLPKDKLDQLGPSALIWLNVFYMRTFMEADLLE